MKKINVAITFFAVTLLSITIITSNLPYKFPKKLEYTESTMLEVRHTESSGGLEVTGGRESIDEYSNEMGYSNVKNYEIYLSGNTPYKEIITFSQGIINYHNFRLYGKFIKEPDKYNILTFQVEEWYPEYKYVRLKDTTEWVKYISIYKNIIRINIYILFLLACIKSIYIIKIKIKMSHNK